MWLSKTYSIAERALVSACACLAITGGTVFGTPITIFTETFQYPVGSNLAGKNGGTGFSGAWTGGNSTIVAGLGGSGSAVQIGNVDSFRSLSTPMNTGGTPLYFSYLMNASSFFGGNYTGISLYNGSNEEMFFGIPWQAHKLGFDARGGTGIGGIRSVDFNPATNTTYLVVLGLLPSSTAGKVDIAMWATTNLSSDPNVLVANAPNASLYGSRGVFSFSQIGMHGDYAGQLKVSGIALSPNVSDASSVTVSTAVPEIDPAGMGSVLALVTGALGLRERRRRDRVGVSPLSIKPGSPWESG